MEKPVLLVVTGRPGAGKTTLAERLSREWYLPLVSRDRIKEGYVHTQQKGHDELPENANLIANNAFFDTVACLLDRGISCIIEAAFQHRVWSERLEAFREKAQIRIVICQVDGQLALERFLERGMKDARRIHYHGDKGVRMLQAGVTPQAGPYDAPHMDLPTCRVDTTQGYHPSLEELRKQILDGETV